MGDIKTKLAKELKSFGEGLIYLVETKTENSMEASLQIVKIATDMGFRGIVVSASRPCENLMELYRKSGIKTDRILLLDVVCRSLGEKIADSSNVIHLQNASALTDISISLVERMKKQKEKSFVFIDSITTMLIHNKPDVFSRFVHSILTKMRLNSTGGILLSLEGETEKEVRAEIAQLCDKTIRV